MSASTASDLARSAAQADLSAAKSGNHKIKRPAASNMSSWVMLGSLS
jgi:hypothetical protein